MVFRPVLVAGKWIYTFIYRNLLDRKAAWGVSGRPADRFPESRTIHQTAVAGWLSDSQMKIAIVAPTPIPFFIGGAEKFFWGLLQAFNRYTPHNVELIKIPCGFDFWSLMRACRRFADLDLGYFDAIISTKDPAWLCPHPNHHLYLQHRCRKVYDLYPSELPTALGSPPHPAFERLFALLEKDDRSLSLPAVLDLILALESHPQAASVFVFPGPLTRAVIHYLDRRSGEPGRIRSYSAISATVAAREGYFPPGIQPVVIHHPSNESGFSCRPGRFVFTASRLAPLKRIDLLLRAYHQVDGETEFRIAGTGEQERELRLLAAGDPRIHFLGYVSSRELLALYAESLFVPFVPYDEDYGLITLEAMLSGKAVLTTTDAGGVTELVRDRVSGLISAPEPEALARAFSELLATPFLAVRLGERGRELAAGITWPAVVERLLAVMSGGF